MWLNRLWLWNSAYLLFNGYLWSFLGDKATGAWSLPLISIQWLLAGPAPCVFYSNCMYTLDSADESNRTLLLSCYVTGATASSGPGPPRSRGFQITQRRTTVDRTFLDEWSARRRDLYLTTHNSQNRQTCRWDSNPQCQQASGRRPTP